MRLVTWNVNDCRAGTDQVIDQLRRIDADVICLEEAHCGGLKASDRKTARHIAAQLGMNIACSDEPEDGSDEEQVVILYSGELHDVEILQVSRRRPYGVAALIDWHGRPIRIVAVHLTSNSVRNVERFFKTGWRRIKEAQDLKNRGKQWTGDVILAGDFDAMVGMYELTLIHSRFNRAYSCDRTFPADLPMFVVDHVFYRGDLRVNHVNALATTASDHRPLVAEIQLLEPDHAQRSTSSTEVMAADVDLDALPDHS